ncbi:hypothetical protein SLI_7911 [Streptomyces lividans 1326]|uniref:Uncharacterized protein n=1 Tax=Streptomyces lividans 1326 TaxID=1200984 RepID=A0A7U9DYQ8_STRLI|nr:hypothetical protein SLI_7911 [Streptomyces lividans 1326]
MRRFGFGPGPLSLAHGLRLSFIARAPGSGAESRRVITM